MSLSQNTGSEVWDYIDQFNSHLASKVRDDDDFIRDKLIENGKKMARVSTSCWFTNLPVSKHNEDLILYKHYTPE